MQFMTLNRFLNTNSDFQENKTFNLKCWNPFTPQKDMYVEEAQ